jgi:protein-L-isoaspartate O-methyltransferase
MQWTRHAGRLSAACFPVDADWAKVVAMTQRHTFIPRWWEGTPDSWQLHDGPCDPGQWLQAAYRPQTLVTRVGTLHADHATDETAIGESTSAATDPQLIVLMLRHGMVQPGLTALCVAGSGYTAALLSRRLGDAYVTVIDIDAYLVHSATERLDSVDLHPVTAVCDITGKLPGEFDRIVSAVSVRPVPQSWLTALNPGGRLITSIAGTGLLMTADKTQDGGAVGKVVDGIAGVFMGVRHSDGYPEAATNDLFEQVRDQDGAEVTTSRFPVLSEMSSWEWDVMSMLELTCPGIEYKFARAADGLRTAWMLYRDGSWARMRGLPGTPSEVHQDGPRRLWNELEAIFVRRELDGRLPAHGADVTITPDGETILSSGGWSVTL